MTSHGIAAAVAGSAAQGSVTVKMRIALMSWRCERHSRGQPRRWGYNSTEDENEVIGGHELDSSSRRARLAVSDVYQSC